VLTIKSQTPRNPKPKMTKNGGKMGKNEEKMKKNEEK
jgi:hypothetical protein